jgi:hypothetical protein
MSKPPVSISAVSSRPARLARGLDKTASASDAGELTRSASPRYEQLTLFERTGLSCTVLPPTVGRSAGSL